MQTLEKEHFNLLFELYQLKEEETEAWNIFNQKHSIEKNSKDNESKEDSNDSQYLSQELAQEHSLPSELQEPFEEDEGQQRSVGVEEQNQSVKSELNESSTQEEKDDSHQVQLTSDHSFVDNYHDMHTFKEDETVKRFKVDSGFIEIKPKPFAASKRKDKGYSLLSTKLRIQAKPLSKLFPSASKVLTTQSWRMAQEETKLLNVLEKIDSLKQENMWSFKQLKKRLIPREKVLWDYLLEEMKWMSEDYRQERLTKIHHCMLKSQMIRDYYEAEDKASLQVKVINFGAMDLDSENAEFLAQDTAMKIDQDQSESRQIESLVDSAEFSSNIIDSVSANIENPQSESLDITENQNPTISPQLLLLKAHPVYVNLKSSVYFVKASSFKSGLENIPTLEPPIYKPGEQVVQDSIVPVSKFMLADYQVKGPEEGIKRLPGVETYEKIKMNSLFSSNIIEAEEDAVELPKCPSVKRPEPKKSPGSWTADEEDALFQLSPIYDYNWELIADSLHGLRVGNTGSRSPWECYDKHVLQIKQKFTPATSTDYVYIGTQANKKNKKVKVLGILGSFNYIINLTKKKPPKPPSKSNKQVNLSAHDTHQKAQTQAGIDINAPPLNSFELSKVKEQRDKLLEQNKQNMYFSQNRAMPYIARPVQSFRAVRPPNVPIGFQSSPPMNNPNGMMGIQPAVQQAGAQQTGMQQLGMQPPGSSNQIPMMMNSNLGRPGAPYTKEQLHMIMMAQRYNSQNVPVRPRNQLQTDISTAAAYAALSNAQNATKSKEINPTSQQPKKVPKQESVEEDLETNNSDLNDSKNLNKRQNKRRRSRKMQISESEEEELEESEELEEEEEEEEEELEEDEESEESIASVQISTRSSTRKKAANKK